jgi:(S)-3,5-dihydroxyphenylglycine transaminase
LARQLTGVKSLLTVNTPPLAQAAAAGALLAAGGSVEPLVAPKRAEYRRRRDALLDALTAECAALGSAVSWRCPEGGFFVPMSLPFDFGDDELRTCAGDYGVIVTPMSCFCVAQPRPRQIRLSFSYVPPERMRTGVARLRRFIADRL